MSSNNNNNHYGSNLTPFYQPLNQQFNIISTPLSAALGAAAQATVPSHPYPGSSAMSMGSGLDSRSETMLSSRTMTSTSSSTGFSVNLGGGGNSGSGSSGGVGNASGGGGGGSGGGNGSNGPMSPTKEMKIAPSFRFGSTSN